MACSESGKRQKTTYRRASIVATTLLYLIAANFYINRICTTFDNVQGYRCIGENSYYSYFAIGFAILPAFTLPIIGRQPSSIILWIIYYTNVISTILCFFYFSNINAAAGWIWIAVIATSYSLIALTPRSVKLKIPHLTFHRIISHVLLLGTTAFAIIYLIKKFGLNLTAPNITDVYAVRAEFKSKLIDLNSWLAGYIILAGGFAIAPIALLIGMFVERLNLALRFLSVFFAIVLSYLIYSIGGYKSVAAIPFAVLLFYLFLSRIDNYGFAIGVTIPIITFAIFILSHLDGLELIFEHWYRRAFISPGMMSTYFFEYIQSRNLENLANAPHIISEYYFGLTGSANTGLYGDGFARLRYIGVAANILILGAILLVVDGAAKRLNPSITGALMVPVAYAASNSRLTALFFTYGLTLIIAFFILGRGIIHQEHGE